ncbi:hypothetical protein GRX03_10190 [Halovenus sp. WSH3]|uniref:DUF7311 domain-containing protein n=1 Tax=Halovenus carboxidivorans TaxID=2692199 RepID=A0A6B0T4S7_9EURY|nr:hypothetical protein [Halovenus carboxidivorans]MXR51967.1 hypothetical protein [Halovenus carboxidivorans]
MIRYVLAFALAATVLGMTATAVDQVATTRGEQAVRAEIQTVESAASELYDEETVPPAGPAPQRIVTVEVHDQRPIRAEPEQIRFERITGAEATRVVYRVRGGPTRERTLDVPIRHADGGPVDLTRWRGEQTLVLRLVARESGDPIVVVDTVD